MANSKHKRPIEIVDLTAEERSEHEQTHHRKAPKLSNGELPGDRRAAIARTVSEILSKVPGNRGHATSIVEIYQMLQNARTMAQVCEQIEKKGVNIDKQALTAMLMHEDLDTNASTQNPSCVSTSSSAPTSAPSSTPTSFSSQSSQSTQSSESTQASQTEQSSSTSKSLFKAPAPSTASSINARSQRPHVWPASRPGARISSYANSDNEWNRENWSIPSTQEDADAEIAGDDEFDDERYQRYELYGTLHTKVVGVRYYDGRATIGELVGVRREPSNPYDRNAMRIDNVNRQQIGHIGRQVAAKIAPLMDEGSIFVEGVLTGEKGAFDMPISLKLFGSGDPVEQAAMQDRFKEMRLPLDHLINTEKERKRAEKEREKAEKQRQKQAARDRQAMAKAAARNAGAIKGTGEAQASQGFTSSAPPPPTQTGPSMEEILSNATDFNPRDLGAVVDKYGSSEEQLSQLPLAPQPDALITQLLPYQRQGLAWLLDRENPTLPAPGSDDTVQLWKRAHGGGFTKIATNFASQAPQLASGGIMADDMGLGKTIQTIALLLADPGRSKLLPTLIVAPLSVMSNWSGQMATHIKPAHSLKVLIYHGANRKNQRPADFEGYDVVITNYETMALEYVPGSRKKPDPIPRATGLFSLKWRRIVLDEGHTIRNSKAKKAQAAYALAALSQSKWVLTGTPIVNNLKDLQSHVRFIGLTGGLEQLDIFSSAVIRPINKGDPAASMLLQALIGTICLRRMKDMKFVDLRLPELSSHKYTVQWQPHEKEKYDLLSSEARGILEQYQAGGRGDDGQNNSYSHILEVLLRLRQVCNHWALCRDRIANLQGLLEKNKQVKLTPENVKALQDLLQLNIDQAEDCPVCFETLHNPVITNCGHCFGGECIERVIEVQQKCPMCRASLPDSSFLVQPTAQMGESTQSGDTSDDAASSKITALLEILNATRRKNNGTKSIVFSQWTSFLDIIQHHLQLSNIPFCRLDGRMSPAARDAAIESLNTDANCTVMLASLSVCSVGLNLCAANQVILVDSWWAAAIEDQAVDRVYRLGQTRPVNVFRLVMEDSIEERVLEVQRQKRALVQTAFGEGRVAGKRGVEKQTRLQDIQRLLS